MKIQEILLIFSAVLVFITAENNTKSSSLQVDYNGNDGLIGIVNKSSNVACILDSHNVIAIIINGQSGFTVVIDINLKLIYRISNGQTVDLKSGFETYFQNLSSLQALLEVGQHSREKYNFSGVTPSVLSDLHSLGGAPSNNGLYQIVLFISQLKGPLGLLYKGKGSFNISKGLQWFENLNLAFAKLFTNNKEISHALNVQVNLATVFGSSSGVEALLNLLSQIGKHEDLSKFLENYLSSPEKLWYLILDVSKGSNDGLDGLITVLGNIINVISGKGTMSVLINSIMHYNPNSEGSSLKISQITNEALDLIQSQNRMFNNFSYFKEIFGFLEALNNNNFMWNNINISDLIKLLRFENPREVAQSIIKIISEVMSSRGIPGLIKSLRNIPGYGNIIKNFQDDVSKMLSNNGNLTTALSNMPVFGNIFRQLSSALGNDFDIGHYFNSSSIREGLNNVIGDNLTHGVFGNMVDSFTNGASQIESEVEHGISSFLEPVKDVFLGSGSGGNSESQTESSTTKDIDSVHFTEGLKSDGFGPVSDRKKHRKHNLHEEKGNKIHHKFHEKKQKQHRDEHRHHQ